jgi:hypothetical protein
MMSRRRGSGRGCIGRRKRPPSSQPQMMDVDQAAKGMKDAETEAEIEDFIEGFNQPTYRGMRINGQRVATRSSQHGWSGDGRPDAEWIQ